MAELNERAREVLRLVVEGYVETGEPVGSRSLTRRLTEALSPATIRNIMADLQDLGLLYAPHTSAGASVACSPSHLSSTLPPNETPASPMGRPGCSATSVRTTKSRSVVSPE